MDINFRTLLKIETILAFLFAVFFISINITGRAISQNNDININLLGIVFFGMGVLGVWGLSRRK